MKKLFYILLILSAVSCQKDEFVLGPSTTVKLNFSAKYDGAPLVINQPYTYADGRKISFSQFDFFISGISLLEEEDGDEVDLVEVALADFTDMTSPAAVHPATFTKYTVPAGKYKGIRIGIGVPSELNKSSANQFGAGHPLRINYDSHFWKDASSFMFMKLGGIYDLNNDGQLNNGPEDNGLDYTPSKNGSYTTITILKPMELKSSKVFDLNLSIDVLKLLMKDNQQLDLANKTNLDTKNPADLTLAKALMGNFQKALTIE